MSDEPHWTEPGAYPVSEGVHRIPLPLPMDGLRAVNVYAIETEEGLTLVDGGWSITESRQQLEAGLAAIDRKPSDITRFLVTHAHRDHYTQAVALRREFGAKVSLGIGDRPTLRLIQGPFEPDPTVTRLQRSGAGAIAAAWSGVAASDRSYLRDYEDPDDWLEGDVTLSVGSRSVEAISTPGHTQGHYVFAETAAGLLFAGDHVLPTITPSIGFEPAYADQPLGDFLASLAKVRALPDLRLLPAHGAVTDSTHARVDALVAHHQDRLDLCLAAITGPVTAYDVARALPWTRHLRDFAELDLFNSALATLETLAHLQLLAAQGRAVASEAAGVLVYSPISGPTSGSTSA